MYADAENKGLIDEITSYKNLVPFLIYKEKLRKDNLFEILDILNSVIDDSKTKIVNLMFYYHLNSQDELK